MSKINSLSSTASLSKIGFWISTETTSSGFKRKKRTDKPFQYIIIFFKDDSEHVIVCHSIGNQTGCI